MVVWGWPSHCRNLTRAQLTVLHLSSAGNGSLVVEGLQPHSPQLEVRLQFNTEIASCPDPSVGLTLNVKCIDKNDTKQM